MLARSDAAVAEATRRGRVAGALAIIAAQEKRRGELLTERTTAATKLGVLQVEAAAVRGERALVKANTGPVHFLGLLLHVEDETLLRWFVLAVACCSIRRPWCCSSPPPSRGGNADMAKRRRRGAWRWIYSGMHCIGQIERDDETGHWRAIVGGQLIGTVANESIAAALVRACAAADIQRLERGRAR